MRGSLICEARRRDEGTAPPSPPMRCSSVADARGRALLGQWAPHPAAAAEVCLDDHPVRRIGDAIEVQIIDTRALVGILRTDVRELLPILEILQVHALVERSE